MMIVPEIHETISTKLSIFLCKFNGIKFFGFALVKHSEDHTSFKHSTELL